MANINLSSLHWEAIETDGGTIHTAQLPPLPFKTRRQYALRLPARGCFDIARLEHHTLLSFINGTGIVSHTQLSGLVSLHNPYRAGLNLPVRPGENINFREIFEETTLVITYAIIKR